MAPFEADGQLAWLHKRGEVQRVVTNDSDLGVLGCSVARIPPLAPFSFITTSQFTGYDFSTSTTVSLGPWPVPPTKPCMWWLGEVCGSEAFTYVASMIGCDYDGKKGFSSVGFSTVWQVCLHMQAHHGRAVNWSPTLIIEALKLKGRAPAREALATPDPVRVGCGSSGCGVDELR